MVGRRRQDRRRRTRSAVRDPTLEASKWTASPLNPELLADLEALEPLVGWLGPDRTIAYSLLSPTGFIDELAALADKRHDVPLYTPATRGHLSFRVNVAVDRWHFADSVLLSQPFGDRNGVSVWSALTDRADSVGVRN